MGTKTEGPETRPPKADASTRPSPISRDKTPLLPTALGALGVVFGDIGTSPLYALNACFHSEIGIPLTSENILGVLSCIFWSLSIVIGVKYALFVMRADDDGEGGVFALLGLLLRRQNDPRARSKWVVLMAACGAALLYGDGVITPAMSVVSAVEGLIVVDASLGRFVVVISVVILVGLFSVQRFGTGPVGKVFGPLMVLWFVWIGGLGFSAILQHPDILRAVNPLQAVTFFANQPFAAFLALGGVVLCVTGGEALYADLGHFSRRSIRLAWYGLVWPALLLNYFGQGASLLHNPRSVDHAFFAIVPEALLVPTIILATVAAVIASQAIITGAFSLSRQGVRLGLLPSFTVIHVSKEMEGRVYLPTVNLLMGCVTLLVVLIFKTSTAMAGAYGIAVTAVMGSTTILFAGVMHFVWKWSWWKSIPIAAAFLAFDLSFLASNLFKIPSGGWFPIGVALCIAATMVTWRAGREHIDKKLRSRETRLQDLAKELEEQKIMRSPGVGIFPTNDPDCTPAALLKTSRHLSVVPEKICVVSMVQSFSARAHKTTTTQISDNIWLVVSRYGYMQTPRVPHALSLAKKGGLDIDLNDRHTTYYLSRERVELTGHSRLMGWQKKLFRSLSRSAAPKSDTFAIPGERVVEIGVPVKL